MKIYCHYLLLLSVLIVISIYSQAKAATIEQYGGSNFVATNIDPALLHDDQSWKDSSIFRTPACQYDTQTAAIDRQLQLMRQNGQKKLGLVLWFTHFDNSNDCAGYLLSSTGGHLSTKVLSNLKHLLQSAGSLGFDEIQIRFAPMGNNWPQQWSEWNQAMFNENWGLISSTITVLSQSHGPHIIYDLSVELAGMKGQSEPYVRNLWAAYTQKFSVNDSYGFSVAIAPGRVGQLLQDLSIVGPLPTEIAIDTYDSDHPGIRVAAEEMHAHGVDLPILVQETLYNDPTMYAALLKQAHENHVKIGAIMQWPLTRGHKTHISEAETPGYIYRPAP